MLKVIGTVDRVGEFKKSVHFGERENRIKDGQKHIENIFEVEREGILQLHIVLSDATIIIVDKIKEKIVTLLNARPSQIKRYYSPLGLTAPVYLLQQATNNVINNLNNI